MTRLVLGIIMKFSNRLLHKCGFSPKVPGKKFINAASKEKKEQFKKKKTQKIISNIPKDFTIAVER